MTAITLEHLHKTLDQHDGMGVRQVQAVRDVSLRIPSGQVIALLGPSGCGKSTLLRLIAGLIPPDHGRVLYDEADLAHIPNHERGIGMVFQEGALIPHWTARSNIGFFLALRNRETEVPERVRRISQITGIGLEQLLDRRPRQLSGGERQRVGIARALTRDPRVFLFDEPFSNLDAKLRTQARVELKRLLQEFPVTSIYVTHDQIEALALTQRTAIMRAGQIEQVGNFETLYHNPINLFVATFIGTPTMRLFTGEVMHGRWYGAPLGHLPIRSDLADGVPVIAGLRAEHWQLSDEGVGARVAQVTPFFAERHLLLEVQADGAVWEIQVPLETRVDVGDQIHCTFDPTAVLFFDAQTERRIG